MLNKIFSIEKFGLHYKIKFLGIKFNVKNIDLAFKQIKTLTKNQLDLTKNELFWLGEEKYSYDIKIWRLSRSFYEILGYFPNFKNPKTFNEKLNWMKFNYYNELQSTCIDKHLVKEYVENKIGQGYCAKLLGVYRDVNDIDFNLLPKSFVIKSPFDGGALGVKVVKDKAKTDIDRLKYDVSNFIQPWNSLYYKYFSRGYKDIKPKIIIEEYLKQLEGQLYDYKIFCFHGEPKAIEAIKDRKNGEFRASFYNEKWELMNLKSGVHKESKIKKPKNFEKMLEIAKVLSADFPFVRVDLYNIDGKIYFGELSFTPASGFMQFNPKEWDYKFGEWLDLNKIPKEFIHPAYRSEK